MPCCPMGQLLIKVFRLSFIAWPVAAPKDGFLAVRRAISIVSLSGSLVPRAPRNGLVTAYQQAKMENKVDPI